MAHPRSRREQTKAAAEKLSRLLAGPLEDIPTMCYNFAGEGFRLSWGPPPAEEEERPSTHLTLEEIATLADDELARLIRHRVEAAGD